MIDPPKATKGRRMSKKSPNKSPTSSSGKPPRKASAGSTRTKAGEGRRSGANKPGGKVKWRREGRLEAIAVLDFQPTQTNGRVESATEPGRGRQGSRLLPAARW